jgi:putative acetyltransferase
MRPMLPSDAPLLAEIMHESVLELTSDDYNAEQQDAWAAVAEERETAEKFVKQLTLVATLAGSPIGFISLAGADRIDMLYVHPAAVGQGAGAMLLDAVEKLAAARGAQSLTVEASDNALPFFQKHGFAGQQRNSILLHGEWLASTTMKKALAQKEGVHGQA